MGIADDKKKLGNKRAKYLTKMNRVHDYEEAFKKDKKELE